MSLTSLSIDALLSLWSDLDDALHGVNGYGSDTAELYAYRFERHDPKRYFGYGSTLQNEAEASDAASSAAALYALLSKFERERDCRVYVDATRDSDGRRLGKWLTKRPFTHRVHVRVKARRPK